MCSVVNRYARVLYAGVIYSRVRQCGAEMLSNVSLQDRVKVLELSVCYKPNYEHLSENKDIFIKM